MSTNLRGRILAAALPVAALFAAPQSAAQSDILLQLRSGSPAGDRFRADSAGGVVAMGTLGIGIIPASGAGLRMMWHPNKAAFRAGSADAGGQFDDANIGYYSWSGGSASKASGIYAFAMGNQNSAEGQCSVAIGSGNSVGSTATCGTALGQNNRVLDQTGVAIGQNAWSDGISAVAIGHYATANGDYSMAFGSRASANGKNGVKVFGDASTTDSVRALVDNEFVVRAAGGVRLRTNAALTSGCNMNAGGSTWTCVSSRTTKENFAAVDGEDVLLRIRATPVTTWTSIAEGPHVRHLGPVAEDFHAAFGLGADSLGIGLGDMDGVNFAAARALEARTSALRRRLDASEARVEALEAALAATRSRLLELAARVEPR